MRISIRTLLVLFFVIFSASSADGKTRTVSAIKTADHSGLAVTNESVGSLDYDTLDRLRSSCGETGRTFVGSCVSMVLPGVISVEPTTQNPSFHQGMLGFDRTFRFVHQDEPFATSETERFANRRTRLVNRVRNLHPNWTARPLSTNAATTPDDPLLQSQGYLDQTNAKALWSRNVPSDSSLGIVVMDTGVNPHPDLSGQIDSLLSTSFVGSTALEDPLLSHGTFVAGIVGAVRNNSLGIAGVGNSQLIMFRIFRASMPDNPKPLQPVEWYSSEAEILSAIQHLATLPHSRKVVVMSFEMGPSDLIRGAMEAQSDTLFVPAAGNFGSEATSFPCAYRMPNSICVGSSKDAFGHFSDFSNRNGVDVLAPGENIYSTWGTDGYTALQGTSFAAPQVAAIAGELWKIHPEVTAEEIKKALLARGLNTNLPGFGFSFADGIPIVNASAALDLLDGKSANTDMVVERVQGNLKGSVPAIGDMISIFGQNMTSGISCLADDFGALPNTLCGMRVLVNGNTLAPLQFVSPGQINVLLPRSPFQIRPGQSKLVVARVDPDGNTVATSEPVEFKVAAVSPAFALSSDGTAILQDENGVQVTSLQPGAKVTMFATGLGAITPDTQFGRAGNGTERVIAPVSMLVGGEKVPVTASVDQKTAGLYQVSFIVPETIPETMDFAIGSETVQVKLPR